MMSKVAVVYKSKYGTTERYAKWISEEVKADIYKSKEVSLEKLLAYDTLVYCGGMYAGGVLGLSSIKKKYRQLKKKHLIVVAVGATLKKEDEVEAVKAKNLTSEMMEEVDFFILRGGLNYKRMRPFDRLLMYIMMKSIKAKKEEELDDDAKGILATYGKEVDFTNRQAINPIVAVIKGNQ